MAPSPTTTAMNPSASPNPPWMDFSTLSGGMPAARPSAILETISARNACSFTTRIRASSSAIAATVIRIR